MKRIKVVWVTCFSNSIIREHVPIRIPLHERLLRWIINKPSINVLADTCIWNTYAASEFEGFSDIELTIITPFFYLNKKEVEFIHNGIRYYVFKDECDNLINRIKKRFSGKYAYKHNTSKILKIIEEIKPDIVHYIGAENPNYDTSALYLKQNYPLIVQLQTLMNEKGFSDNYDISKKDYLFRSSIEFEVIKRADYIGISANHFREVIHNDLKLDKNFLDIYLALTEPVNTIDTQKSFDFIYFANDISKSFDVALEAFNLVKQLYGSVTMDVVGNYSTSFKERMDERINVLGLKDSITFEGRLPSHDDVICQIRKSRFAILPLKVDLISGTIREAMANGIPVITTITPETPNLNKRKECVLLSPKDDIESLSENMIRLLNDPELSERLKNNALETANERPSNRVLMQAWVEEYKRIVSKKNDRNSR